MSTNTTSSPRKRTTKPNKTSSNKPIKPSLADTATPTPAQLPKTPLISLTDILRLLSTLIALTISLSYYLTSGESLFFNQRLPWFLHPARLQAYVRGPLLLTPSQLALYNGTAYPNLPILLAINGTIFDVSASPHTYGPGGSYHVFAGRDATRAFVTGCFQSDLNADLRGLERLYVPVEDVDEGRGEMTPGEKKIRAEQEGREARKRVRAEVERWVGFYSRHEKYFEVGRLVGGDDDDGDGRKGEVKELCESAEMARPRRSQIIAEARANAGGKGKPVFRPKKGENGNGKPV